ncbi:MAG: hypothetical protein IKY16_03160 [Bacteroidales bacterium]|nr:hypothetical protein [Bacteroidales bacterium]
MKSVIYLLILCFSVVSCRQEIASTAVLDAEDGNFTYSAEGSTRLLIMDIPIGSRKSSMIFDTGGLGLLLDSLTAAQCLNMKKLEREGKATESSVYFPAASRDFFGTTYFHPIDIPFYGGTLHYDWFMVFDGLKDEFQYDGIFSIPQDDTRIWNFDFENLSLSVSDVLSVSQKDSSDFVCNIERRGEKIYLTDFPISFSGEDKLSMKQELLLDTGCSSALAFNFNEGELDEERQFMEDNALLYYKTYVGDHTFVIYSPDVINDTLMVTFRQKDQRSAGFPHFVGLELLSKFDIAIDLADGKAYFRRNGTGNWAEYLNENSSFERKALSLIPDDDFKTAFVKSIGKESPAYVGGLRRYDVIEKFDGGTFSSYNTRYMKMRQRGESETFTFDIDRFGEKKRIQVSWRASE